MRREKGEERERRKDGMGGEGAARVKGERWMSVLNERKTENEEKINVVLRNVMN